MKNDDGLIRLGDVAAAVHLLSRLPVPGGGDNGHRGAAAAWAYPLAGLVIGGVASAVALLAHWLGLPAPLTALLCLATTVMITGALHEDGLSDTFDGLWGGWSADQRLKIMKDSHIGAYGMIALFFGLAARWVALWLLFDHGLWAGIAGLLAAASLSRAMMPTVMAALPHARQEGLSAHVGQVARPTALVALGIGLGAALLLTGWAGLGALFWAALITVALASIAKAKIGGQTGDILGATQQLAEIAILFSLVA